MSIRTATHTGVVVTADNFVRAESDKYFTRTVNCGGLGAFVHYREPMPIHRQTVVRPNRDTLYSSAVFDLDAAPVTITLPDTHGRFMSIIVIDQDQYASAVVYAPGEIHLSRDQVDTRYVLVGIRILIRADDPDDLALAHLLQDAVTIHQSRRGQFDVPVWDDSSQRKVRDALLVLGSTLPDMNRTFGRREQVDPLRHVIGTAMGWGGNPDQYAVYLNVTPRNNDGATIYSLTVGDVPVDAFWSISVYNLQGYFHPNQHNVYTVNSVNARKRRGGLVTVQFGGYDGKTANCLPITPGWNYMVRLYRPRPEVLDGSWIFPGAQPI